MMLHVKLIISMNFLVPLFLSNLKSKVSPPKITHQIPDIPFNPHSILLSPTNECEVNDIIIKLKNKAGSCDT